MNSSFPVCFSLMLQLLSRTKVKWLLTSCNMNFCVWFEIHTITSSSYLQPAICKVTKCSCNSPLTCVGTKRQCKRTDRKSSCRSLDLSFWRQTCALLTFMSVKCSDTERWSHWQRPAFAGRSCWSVGCREQTQGLHAQWRVIKTH